MASALLRGATQSTPYICARCAFRTSQLKQPARRWIGTKYLAKQATAKEEWDTHANKIRAGEEKSMLSLLEERGLVHQLTGTRDQVEKLMTDNRIGAYVGIDPTAPSIHLGHMLPLMCIFWLYIKGYHAITLLGGATAKVGDPTDRLKSREKQDSSLRTENMVKMHYQLKTLWANVEKYGKKYGYHYQWAWKRGLLNNNMWMNKLTLMEIIQTLGPGMRMGAMLARDTVKNKMEKGDGMSWAEFTYPILQAWDWWHMYRALQISMQIGGSDQYGNITAGIDAVKYISANHPDPDIRKQCTAQPFGFTVPLLTNASGQKFGKSAGNAVFLDEEMTSSFELYGYFLRTSDADVDRYLKLFTFMPVEKIDSIMEAHLQDPSKRKAQHALALDFVELVHGSKNAVDAANQHFILFGTKPEELLHPVKLPDNISIDNRPKPSLTLPRSFILTKSIGRIIHAAGLTTSATEGHQLITKGGLYIGGQPSGYKGPMADGALNFTPIKLWRVEDTTKFLIDDRLLILRRGKNNIRVIDVIDDAAYAQSGKTFPGYEGYDEEKIAEDVAKYQGPQSKLSQGQRMDETKFGEDLMPQDKELSEKVRQLRRERGMKMKDYKRQQKDNFHLRRILSREEKKDKGQKTGQW